MMYILSPLHLLLLFHISLNEGEFLFLPEHLLQLVLGLVNDVHGGDLLEPGDSVQFVVEGLLYLDLVDLDVDVLDVVLESKQGVLVLQELLLETVRDHLLAQVTLLEGVEHRVLD